MATIPGRKRTKGKPWYQTKRYIRKGSCLRCGWCCGKEDCEHFIVECGMTTCLIHDSPDRPQKCKNFPQAPPILNPGCGYYFWDTWENKKVKLGSDL